MLVELKVSHFAIINQLALHFQSGLNILSGETGAGKSIVLKSLALLMGEKADAETVRQGAEQAVVEGLFELTERPDVRQRLLEIGVDIEEDSLVVRRVITSQGKSKVYLNGQLSALATLRDVVAPLITVTGAGSPLIEMTGQHENRHLQSRAYHLDLLDHYCGTLDLRQTYAGKYQRIQDLHSLIARLDEEERTRAQRLDFLTFQRDEIKNLDLKPGEDEALEAQIRRLRHSAKLSDFIQAAQAHLYGDDDSVTVRLHQLMSRAQELRALDPSLADRIAGLSQAKALIEDAVYELREYSRELTSDPEELNRIEERLSQLRRLQKKFGASVGDILAQLEKIEGEILKLESAETERETWALERDQLATELEHLAKQLHLRRESGAKLLSDSVNAELSDLNMKGVQFGVALEKREEAGPTGISEIEFTIQPSKKEEARPLAKFASGGELSRILLALKRVVGHSDLPRTYLFDEVDAGVSGQTAEKVGRKLKSIAKGQQVICVTHLPQVAAFADAHFAIGKEIHRGSTEMRVVALDKSERVKEIARLISGEKITTASLDHARQLVREASAP